MREDLLTLRIQCKAEKSSIDQPNEKPFTSASRRICTLSQSWPCQKHVVSARYTEALCLARNQPAPGQSRAHISAQAPRALFQLAHQPGFARLLLQARRPVDDDRKWDGTAGAGRGDEQEALAVGRQVPARARRRPCRGTEHAPRRTGLESLPVSISAAITWVPFR